MNETIINLEAGMTFQQVAALAGRTAIFRVDGTSASHGGGLFWEETKHGEGTVWGETLTEPPFKWSVETPNAIPFEKDQVLSATALKASGASLSTFQLEALL